MILGIGIDIVEIERVKKVYDRYPERTLKKLYGHQEREYIESKKNPYPHLAARFCAKEAFSKALGTGIGMVSFKDFQVVNDEMGNPHAFVTGRAETLLKNMGGKKVHVSLSHTGGLAIAQVLITS